MQSHLGSVVVMPDQHCMVGSKFFVTFTRLVEICKTFAECKTNRLAMLTVMSNLDPHIINLWKLKLICCIYFMMMLFYINCGMVYTYTCQ
jgi:hypothetical protein